MMRNTDVRPMWWVMREGNEKLIAICDNEEDAYAIKELYETHKEINCVVRIAFTR